MVSQSSLVAAWQRFLSFRVPRLLSSLAGGFQLPYSSNYCDFLTVTQDLHSQTRIACLRTPDIASGRTAQNIPLPTDLLLLCECLLRRSHDSYRQLRSNECSLNSVVACLQSRSLAKIVSAGFPILAFSRRATILLDEFSFQCVYCSASFHTLSTVWNTVRTINENMTTIQYHRLKDSTDYQPNKLRLPNKRKISFHTLYYTVRKVTCTILKDKRKICEKNSQF
jgi:hypothetical protein